LRARTLRQQVILLPALAFRLLFPAGFMPRFGGELELRTGLNHADERWSAASAACR
jgi:hypothetical protein